MTPDEMIKAAHEIVAKSAHLKGAEQPFDPSSGLDEFQWAVNVLESVDIDEMQELDDAWEHYEEHNK